MSVTPEIADLLDERVMAHLATCRDGRPHAAPVWFVHDDGVVELITTGRKLANVRANPRVALSIQKDTDGETEWTVTLLGTAEVVEDEAATREARRRINRKYGAPEDAYSDNALVRVSVGTATHETY
jgi:PPOX class probable F420-dependent enzyme